MELEGLEAAEIWNSSVELASQDVEEYGPYGEAAGAITLVGGAVAAGGVALWNGIKSLFHSDSRPVIASPKPADIKPKAIVQSTGGREGKDFTPKGKQQVIDENKAKNNGQTVCENCGVNTTKPEKSQKGKTPPKTDTQVDHIKPKSKGGAGTADNGQVLCRDCNIKKGDSDPTENQPQQQKPPENPQQGN